MSENRRAMVFVLASALLWSVMEATATLFIGHYSPFQVVWLRYAVHLSLMITIWGWREPAVLWRTRRPLFQISRSMLMIGMPASWIIGTKLGVTPSNMLSVFWLNPVILLLIAWCFLRELAPAFVWIVTGIACAGALLLLQPRAETPPYLLLFPLAMATCFGAYIAMTRSLRTEDRRANLFYTALGVFVVFTPLIAHVWIAPSPTDLLVFIGIGVLGFFGLYAIDVGAATAPVSVCAPVTYSQLIFVMAPAVTVASQESTGLGRIGMLLLSISVACAWIRAPHLKLLEAR